MVEAATKVSVSVECPNCSGDLTVLLIAPVTRTDEDGHTRLHYLPDYRNVWRHARQCAITHARDA